MLSLSFLIESMCYVPPGCYRYIYYIVSWCARNEQSNIHYTVCSFGNDYCDFTCVWKFVNGYKIYYSFFSLSKVMLLISLQLFYQTLKLVIRSQFIKLSSPSIMIQRGSQKDSYRGTAGTKEELSPIGRFR